MSFDDVAPETGRWLDTGSDPVAPRRAPLVDGHGRVKRKLRLSVTDRCNFRCRYCMPERVQWQPREQLLTRPELARLAREFVTQHGVTRIRLTGGEPLVRGDVPGIVADLAALKAAGLERLSLTTNGALLAARAGALREAGLDDLNVSLDARSPAAFKALTGADVEPVLRGIDAARAAGLPVKLNTVVIRGYNDHEIVPLARWARAEGLELRFIEFMPLDGRGFWSRDKVVTEAEIVAALSREFAVERLPRDASPATPYRLDGRALGVISTVSSPFCASCDRVRVTATGELFACLFSAQGADLRAPLRAHDAAALEQRIRDTVWRKQAGYVAHPGYVQRPVTMHRLGG